MRYLPRMSISRYRAQLAVLLLLAACGGPTSGGAGISNTTAAAAGGEPSVRTVDWMNRTYEHGENGTYTVVNGEYEYAYDEDGNIVAADYQPRDPDAYIERGYFSVSQPAFGDLTGDGVEEAVIVIMESTGGTGRFSGIDVYGMRAGQPVIIGGIPGGDRGDGGISDIALEGSVVVVQRLASQEGDGACCPSKVQIERWTWNGSAFVEDEAARKLEDFGE